MLAGVVFVRIVCVFVWVLRECENVNFFHASFWWFTLPSNEENYHYAEFECPMLCGYSILSPWVFKIFWTTGLERANHVSSR